MPSEAPCTASDSVSQGCEPGGSIRLRWRNSKAVRSGLRYFRRLVSAAVLALAGCVWQSARRPADAGRTCACIVPPPCCALRWRGTIRAILGAAARGGRSVSFGRPPPGRACARRPGRCRCGAVPLPPVALCSGVGSPPARLRAPGGGRGLSPFGALLRLGGALLPPFSSPPPPPGACGRRLRRRCSLPERDSSLPGSGGWLPAFDCGGGCCCG